MQEVCRILKPILPTCHKYLLEDLCELPSLHVFWWLHSRYSFFFFPFILIRSFVQVRKQSNTQMAGLIASLTSADSNSLFRCLFTKTNSEYSCSATATLADDYLILLGVLAKSDHFPTAKKCLSILRNTLSDPSIFSCGRCYRQTFPWMTYMYWVTCAISGSFPIYTTEA